MIDRLTKWAAMGCFLLAGAGLGPGCSEPAGDSGGTEAVGEKEAASVQSRITFSHEPNILHILVDGQPFGDYVYYNRETPRPYFASVRAPGGLQVTRSRPPVDGVDLMDHADMHPGIWLSFGDLDGNDYWRLKNRVEHERFIDKPQAEGDEGSFAVRNFYLDQAGENRIAQEEARYTLTLQPEGCLLALDTTFQPYGDREQIVFGDQEEMGFSVRLNTPLVEQFGGKIVDSKGRSGADAIWSQSADWIDYSGELEGKWVGVTLIPHPENFRESWYHVRDYGLLTANPFGRQAMGKGSKSEVIVKKGESLRLRFGLLIHASVSKETYNPAEAFKRCLELFKE